MTFLKAESTPVPAMQGWVSAGPIFLVNDGDENHQFSVFDFFEYPNFVAAVHYENLTHQNSTLHGLQGRALSFQEHQS